MLCVSPHLAQKLFNIPIPTQGAAGAPISVEEAAGPEGVNA
jgi:hypothetical protein